MSELKRGISSKRIPLWPMIFAVLSLAAACGPAEATYTPNPFGFLSEPVNCEDLEKSDWSQPVASLEDNFFNNFSTKGGRVTWDCADVQIVLDQFDSADDLLVDKFGVDASFVKEATDRIERIEIVDNGTSRFDRSKKAVQIEKRAIDSASHEKMHTVLGKAYWTDTDGTRYYYAEFTEGLAEYPTLSLDSKHPNSAYQCANGQIVNYHKAASGMGQLLDIYPSLLNQSASLNNTTPLGYPVETLAKNLGAAINEEPSQVLQNIYKALPAKCRDK